MKLLSLLGVILAVLAPIDPLIQYAAIVVAGAAFAVSFHRERQRIHWDKELTNALVEARATHYYDQLRWSVDRIEDVFLWGEPELESAGVGSSAERQAIATVFARIRSEGSLVKREQLARNKAEAEAMTERVAARYMDPRQLTYLIVILGMFFYATQPLFQLPLLGSEVRLLDLLEGEFLEEGTVLLLCLPLVCCVFLFLPAYLFASRRGEKAAANIILVTLGLISWKFLALMMDFGATFVESISYVRSGLFVAFGCTCAAVAADDVIEKNREKRRHSDTFESSW